MNTLQSVARVAPETSGDAAARAHTEAVRKWHASIAALAAARAALVQAEAENARAENVMRAAAETVVSVLSKAA